MWTNRNWPNLPIDLGASWIHGHQGNPMTELAARYEVPTVATDFDFVAAYDGTGRSLKLSEVSRVLAGLRPDAQGARRASRRFAASGQVDRMSLEEAIRRWQELAKVPTEDRKLQRFVTRSEIEIETAADVDELQFPGWDHEQEFAGEQRMFPTGYGSIIDGLAKGLDIQLQTIVHMIDYSGSRVR